jgi:enolase
VLDSRGRPTLEVEAHASNGVWGVAIVPSGASTGRHEALELRDGDPARYDGFGVLRAVGNVTNEIAPALAGWELDDQQGIDATMIALDGTPNKSRLGANAMLGVSLAVAHAASAYYNIKLYAYINKIWHNFLLIDELGPTEPILPLPMINMISGGLHAGRRLDFQDFLIIPIGARTYSQALEWSARVYRSLARVLELRGEECHLVADEGGFAPRLARNEEALLRLMEAIELANLVPGDDVALAIDVAASQLYRPGEGLYTLNCEDRCLCPDELIELLGDWTRRYPIISLEDPLAEDDWDAWTKLTAQVGHQVQVIGDDLFCTQVPLIEQGIARKAANAVLIKPNQVGTLSETFDALRTAARGGFRCVVSARSGETEDWTIADLAAGTSTRQIKIGSLARSERLAKYNRLLRLEAKPDALKLWG